MNELSRNLQSIKNNSSVDKEAFVGEIAGYVTDAGYTIVELNDKKPWGAYIRISSDEADRFVNEFFPGLTPEAARLGMKDAILSPKFLIFAPGHRISWQYHGRRAERWMFLTSGLYWRGMTDEEVEATPIEAGHVVQFEKGERHRGGASDSHYTIIAEIWQHTDVDAPSDEDDIVRVADDYNR